jgi:hypothetical protein
MERVKFGKKGKEKRLRQRRGGAGKMEKKPHP